MPYKNATSIGVDKETKEILKGLKEEKESWGAFMKRLAQYNKLKTSADSETDLI